MLMFKRVKSAYKAYEAWVSGIFMFSYLLTPHPHGIVQVTVCLRELYLDWKMCILRKFVGRLLCGLVLHVEPALWKGGHWLDPHFSRNSLHFGFNSHSLFASSKINQSSNQTSITPISPAKPGSVVRQPNLCSTAKSRKQFHNINRPWGMPVSMG